MGPSPNRFGEKLAAELVIKRLRLRLKNRTRWAYKLRFIYVWVPEIWFEWDPLFIAPHCWRMRLRLIASDRSQRYQSHRSKGRTSEHNIEAAIAINRIATIAKDPIVIGRIQLRFIASTYQSEQWLIAIGNSDRIASNRSDRMTSGDNASSTSGPERAFFMY